MKSHPALRRSIIQLAASYGYAYFIHVMPSLRNLDEWPWYIFVTFAWVTTGYITIGVKNFTWFINQLPD